MSTTNTPRVLPDSPLPHIGDTHIVQFYEDDTFLIDAWSAFAGRALAGGEAAIVIAAEGHRNEITRQLETRGVNVARASQEGRYVSLDASETLAKLLPSGSLEATRFAEIIGGAIMRANAAAGRERPRAAVFGEMVALLWNQGDHKAALRLEQLWNELAQELSFSLRCAYPMKGFHREEHGHAFLQLCAEHTHVVPSENFTALLEEQDRFREIARLQQKAQALERENAERKDLQESLEQRQAELHDFLENAVEGVQQVGPDHRVLWANRWLLNLLGYSAEEYVGHDLAEFHVRRENFDEYWRKLMRHENICDYAAGLRCKDGSVKQVLIHSKGLWAEGRFVHTRCFIRDVTKQKRMAQALRQSEKLAATGRLAATIAHEINNPLEALTNLFYLLQWHPSLDDAARGYAALADQELRRIAHITKQMLGFYRESPRPVPLKMSEILDSVVELYARRLSSHDIRVQKHYATEGALEGFPSELRQLLTNLVRNATEASRKNGKIHLHIRETRDWRRPSRRGVRVSIADNGSGIPAATQKKIFEPFFTTKGESATGLGLWASRAIVDRHEGSIRLRSSDRQGRSGTVFSVFLPIPANAQRTAPLPVVTLAA